jgi:hypothetical protein
LQAQRGICFSCLSAKRIKGAAEMIIVQPQV